MKNLSQKCKKLLARKPDSHKGNFGHVLIIGGDYGMGGAVIMAAEAAYRAGAGKVSVLTRQEHILPLLTRLPNAMYIAQDDNAQKIEKIFADKNVIVIGPGLGKSEWSQDLLNFAMQSNLPKIIDADALNLISDNKNNFIFKNCVMTPHVGEAARLLASSPSIIQKNREAAIKKLHAEYGATIVLKGQGSLVLGAKKVIEKCEFGNAGMAVAGMGDLLSGLIAGLVAQNVALETAAVLAVNIHACAGDLVAKKQGAIGMVPSDLLNYFSIIINGKSAA